MTRTINKQHIKNMIIESMKSHSKMTKDDWDEERRIINQVYADWKEVFAAKDAFEKALFDMQDNNVSSDRLEEIDPAFKEMVRSIAQPFVDCTNAVEDLKSWIKSTGNIRG